MSKDKEEKIEEEVKKPEPIKKKVSGHPDGELDYMYEDSK